MHWTGATYTYFTLKYWAYSTKISPRLLYFTTPSLLHTGSIINRIFIYPFPHPHTTLISYLTADSLQGKKTPGPHYWCMLHNSTLKGGKLHSPAYTWTCFFSSYTHGEGQADALRPPHPWGAGFPQIISYHSHSSAKFPQLIPPSFNTAMSNSENTAGLHTVAIAGTGGQS